MNMLGYTIKQMSYAYATLVMIDYKYVIGAISLSQSLMKSESKYDTICMVTPDIDTCYVELLKPHFTHVVHVPYINIQTKPFKSEKRKSIYQKWINKSYTKLNIMNLDNYDKVCWLDSDMVIINNIDHLFQLTTPIGVFSNHWFDHIEPKYNNRNFVSCNFYKKYNELDIIPHDLINKSLNNNGFVASGNLFIINPSRKELSEMLVAITADTSFGFNCASGGDEQALCYYQSVIKNRDWTCLKLGYNVIPWKLDESLGNAKPYILHFNMENKPWDINSHSWEDVNIWWAYANLNYNIKPLCSILNIKHKNINDDLCMCIIFKTKHVGNTIACPIHN